MFLLFIFGLVLAPLAALLLVRVLSLLASRSILICRLSEVCMIGPLRTKRFGLVTLAIDLKRACTVERCSF